MPQFVILRHTLPAGSPRPSHFDLMLERDGQLLTGAIAELPYAGSQSAEELPPHRIDYLQYEGPVSNNRGDVQRVVFGSFDWQTHTADTIHVTLHSSQLSGELQLQREEGNRWNCHMM
jgi:hypothetical protein